MNNYYGFVYIWRDRKNKMFYIGSHMGGLDDGYVGSSTRLTRAYKKRPLDFTRRILDFCMENSKVKLHEMEEKWLNLIKVEELGKKYYNLKRVAAGGNVIEHYTPEQKLEYRAKLKKSASKRGSHHRARKVICFGVLYECIQDAISAIGFNPQKRLTSRKYIDFYYFDQGPITELEIADEKRKKEISRKNGIEARGKAISAMPKEERKEKALKSAATRRITCPNIGDRISEGLKNRLGRNVSIEGVIYNKGRTASEKLGINYGTIKARLKSKNFPTWFYLDDSSKNTNLR